MFVKVQRVIVSDLLGTIFFLPFSHKSQRQGAKHDAKIWREKIIDSSTGSGLDYLPDDRKAIKASVVLA